MSRALGLAAELADTDVTAVAVTPGWIRSEAMLEGYGVIEETWRDAVVATAGFAISESPTFVARGVAALAADTGRKRSAPTSRTPPGRPGLLGGELFHELVSDQRLPVRPAREECPVSDHRVRGTRRSTGSRSKGRWGSAWYQ